MWSLVEHVAPRVVEPFPEVKAGGLPTRAEAIRALHFPRDPRKPTWGGVGWRSTNSWGCSGRFRDVDGGCRRRPGGCRAVGTTG
jgi:hypothetical protein